MISQIIQALNLIQQIKEEVIKAGFNLGTWVEVIFKVFPSIVNILQMFAKSDGAPMAGFGAVQSEVEAAGFDFVKWVNLLMKIAPLIQQLIDIFTVKEDVVETK